MSHLRRSNAVSRSEFGDHSNSATENVRRAEWLRQKHSQIGAAAQASRYYLNPDEIEKDLHERGALDFTNYQVTAVSGTVLNFLQNSILLQSAGLAGDVERFSFADNTLMLGGVKPNAYLASVVSDFLRRRLIEQKISFTLETVMSSPDKIALLEKARIAGYRTYLYYIATDDPLINVSRVRSRVSRGGHPVPEDKIVSRYARSLDLLMKAIRHTNRAYVFDNSGHQQERTWLAEITDGRVLEMKTDQMPAWFKKAVWDKIASSVD